MEHFLPVPNVNNLTSISYPVIYHFKRVYMNLICIIFPADWQCLFLQLQSQKICWLRFEQERSNKENWEINVKSGYKVLKTILITSYSHKVGATILIYAWEVFLWKYITKATDYFVNKIHSLPYLQSLHQFLN